MIGAITGVGTALEAIQFLTKRVLGGAQSFSAEPVVVGDDGGDIIQLVGPWVDEEHDVTIGGVSAASAIAGEGYDPEPDGEVLEVVVPVLPVGGPYSVVATWSGGSVTITDIVTVERRERRRAEYHLRRMFPTGPFDRGITKEEIGELFSSPVAPYTVTNHLLDAVLSGVGETLNELHGLIFTRLISAMQPDDTTAVVETTHEFPTAGKILIAGEEIEYTGTSANSITGLVRGVTEDIYREGTPVALWTRDNSALEVARESLLLETAEGAFLDQIGMNYGVPRYLEVDDDTYRELIRVLAYQPGRGSPTAIGEFLDVLLPAYEIGVVSVGATGLIFASAGGFTPGMVGMRLRIYDFPTAGEVSVFKIISYTDTNYVNCSIVQGRLWESAEGNSGAGLAELMSWDIEYDPYDPAVAHIIINLPTKEDDPAGLSFIQGGEIQNATGAFEVTVDYDIRQVIGVWLTGSTTPLGAPTRKGTNYATSNTFSGRTITLDTPVSAGAEVYVDYASVARPVNNFQAGWCGPSAGPYTDVLPSMIDRTQTTQVILGTTDLLYVGHDEQFDEIRLEGLAGTGASAIGTYWDGSTWQSFAFTDGTSGLTVDGSLTFTPSALTGWTKRSLSGEEPKFYVGIFTFTAGKDVTATFVGPGGVSYEAVGPASAQVLKDETWTNPVGQFEIDTEGYTNKSPGGARYPLYIGNRLGTLEEILEIMTIAGIRPVVESRVW